MGDFHNYLKRAKQAVGNLQQYETVYVVMGNETCDLDSAVSALCYGFLLHALHVNTDPSKCIAVPILNITDEDLPLKTEACFLLRKLRVNLRDLVFRNEIDLKALQNASKLNVTLVDHHVLSKDDAVVAESVVEIYDHRPISSDSNWDERKVRVRIEPVGSCCTIIAEKILNDNATVLNNIVASLLYETILFDTIGLCQDAGKAKPLDVEIINRLQTKFNLSDNYKKIFDNLWTVHNDVSHLTPLQILSRDLKIVDGVPVPALPMLAAAFLDSDGAETALVEFCERHDCKISVVLGIDVVDGAVRRDVALFKTEPSDLYLKIVKSLTTPTDGYNLELVQSSCAVASVDYFTQGNIKLTRKQIIPLIKTAFH